MTFRASLFPVLGPTRVWRGIEAQDPPWAALDYADLLAMAQTMLAARQKRFPALVKAGKLKQADADAELAVFTAIAADWHWIVTGEGEPAPIDTLDARRAALDASLDTIVEIARERGGFGDDLALQTQHVIAMRWHLEPERKTHRLANLTHQIAAHVAQLKADAALNSASPATSRKAA